MVQVQGPANVVGAPVRGADFWGRRADVDALWRQLACGSVLLTGPRRHGKSSLMHALADEPRPGWTVARGDESAAVLPDVLALLESDYYVVCDGGRVAFSSGFLRAWWARNAARSRSLS